jgi:hypothetical protein
VNNELGFVHNGVIRAVDKNDKYSDTNMFNRQILRMIPQMSIEFMSNPALKTVFGDFIAHSKLIFMNNFGEATIVNEHKGDWEEDGIWYSNDSHKRVKNTVDFGGKTMTREEHKRLQGGVTSSSRRDDMPWNGSETGIGYRHYDENSEDYGSLNGSIMDLHDASTIADVTRAQNARIGRTYDVYEGSNYIVSDGGLSCESCGIHSLTGELMSADKECLECVSQEEAGAIMSAAVNDGALLDNYSGTTIVDQASLSYEDFEREIVECDNCTSVVEMTSSRLRQWTRALKLQDRMSLMLLS